MANVSQLFLLADHIKLSLLERQRAVSLGIEPNAADSDISRALESLRQGIETAATSTETDADDVNSLRALLEELVASRPASQAGPASEPAAQPASAALAQPVPQQPSKSVRFMENYDTDDAADDDDDDSSSSSSNNNNNGDSLFQPYRDSPSPQTNSAELSNAQIHARHGDTLRQQDEQLDRLGESIGRQHQLSIQIGDELDGHAALLDGLDGDVDRHQSRLERARRRLDSIRRRAADNWSMMTIVGLIIVLVILIVILK